LSHCFREVLFHTETTIGEGIEHVFHEADLPSELFKPDAGRGTAGSLLYDVYLQHKEVFVDFAQEVSEARARHSFSQFNQVYVLSCSVGIGDACEAATFEL